MKILLSDIKKIMKNRMGSRRGMTMAEVLIVIAILGVLAGVAFVSVQAYQRSMAQLERDNIAKEIYVAAQNHLSMAKGEGYLGAAHGSVGDAADKDIRYFSVLKGDAFTGGTVLDLMLPFGSIDETIRVGGNYIISYRVSTGVVQDVLYCSTGGSPGQFNVNTKLTYDDIKNYKGTDKAGERKNWTDGSVLGWYGDTTGGEHPGEPLKSPVLTVTNASKLSATYTDSNNKQLRLLIKGESSGHEYYVNLKGSAAPSPSVTIGEGGAQIKSATIVLDDITKATGHFKELKFDGEKGNPSFTAGTTPHALWPGENITLQLVAFDNDAYSSVAYSNKVTVNSLFADGTTNDTAYIGNIRHLENLDYSISNLDKTNLSIAKAAEGSTRPNVIQTADLSWEIFKNDLGGSLKVYGIGDTSGTNENCYRPVNPDYRIIYDGQRHSISDVKVIYAGDAGLFGQPTGMDGSVSVSNLKLLDFDIQSTSDAGTAGALIGTLKGTVTNVLVRNTKTGFSASVPNVQAKGAAGGLIGNSGSNNVTRCAAAVYVKSLAGNAGGLIGTASGGTISGCYSGGHTDKGEYYEHGTDGKRAKDTDGKDKALYNVTGAAAAGGLIGASGSAAITNSYSTCSVSGATAGGLVGSAAGNITSCYCTGLVTGTTAGGAFAGSYSGTAGNCKYYEIINEIEPDANNTSYTYLSSVGNNTDNPGITAFDRSAADYNAFVGPSEDWKTASAYDKSLREYYSGKYNLRTVAGLGAAPGANDFVAIHYGDWPAPEIFVINK